MGMPGNREADVLRAVLELLELHRVFHWRANTGGMRGSSGAYIAFGVPGQPDVFAVIRGHLLCLETKRPGGQVRPQQQAWLDNAAKAGATVAVITDVGQLAKLLADEFGVGAG